MALVSDLRRQLDALRSLFGRTRNAEFEPSGSLPNRLVEVISRTWDLGFTAFGGPAVHFKILHDRFVEGSSGEKWIDEQTYQELFAICQALPGPGSTKMIFCIALLRAGFIPAVVVFFIWSLPGAIVMYGLSLGVQRINDTLPSPVYALLSGLNASTVGIVALAAVQLAEKAIRDQLTRVLVIFGACAGLCYNALWYFPVLVLAGGIVTLLWDGLMSYKIKADRRHPSTPERSAEETANNNSVPLEEAAAPSNVTQRKMIPPSDVIPDTQSTRVSTSETPVQMDHVVRNRVGIALVITFFASFLAIMLLRGLLKPLPRPLAVFSNMYLAGTIIFGGGPVVIPLLRSYVVDPGWVSSRDFLIGLAIIQALPGPNFNFAVYLGALALQHTSTATVLGAILGFIGVFIPGISLAVAVQGFWRVLRTRKWVVGFLRGVNATAVGLVFTAVYRLWEIGYLTPEKSAGQSLATDPWWVVVTGLAYAESAWFHIPPALAIVIGAVLGLLWYAAVGR